MDISKDRKFLVYLGIGATLGAAYLAIDYLSNRKTSLAKPLTLEKTRKILQQIKFQILTTCTTFVQGLKNKPKTNHSQQDLEIFYRSELAKVYEMREDTILTKYTVSKDQYAASLNYYKKDAILQQGQREIIDILQNATKSLFPDYNVPRQAKLLLSQQQVPQIYLEMCELISIKVWQKLDQQKQKNPGFNSKDDAHFKKAIRQISIYDIKSQFLQKKGFKPEWGCPNEVFYKVMESLKQENKEIKNRATIIQKAYEKIIERITNQPQHLNTERIKFLFDQIVNNKVPQVKPMTQAQQKPQVSLQSSVQNVSKKAAPPAKKDDDFNMDELMMQQLMSRSQEDAKQVKISESVPKIQQKQQIKQQPKKQQPKENLDQINQRANPGELRQKDAQQQEAGEQSQELKKEETEQPIAEVQKIQEVVEPVNVEIVHPENIEEEVSGEVLQNQAEPQPAKVEETVEASQFQNNQIQNVPEVEERLEEVQATQIPEAKEIANQAVVAQQVSAQNTNTEIQNEVLPEQEFESKQE